MRNLSIRLLLLSVVITLAGSTHAFAQCAAYGANPNDWIPDNAELNECFKHNAYVYLDRGNPGYIIDDSLFFRSNQVLLTSSSPDKAILIAGPNLVGPMLNVVDFFSGWEISELRFDGRKDIRARSDMCGVVNNAGLNLYVQGSSFKLHHVDVLNAMCLGGGYILGDNFEIYSTYVAYNGTPQNETPNRYANGFHVIRCTGGYIHDNWFVENTDVGLAIVTGNNCLVLSNQITNQDRQAFAGLHVGDSSSSDLAGSVVAYNTITSGFDKLPFGLVVGPHAWNDGSSTYGSVGQVTNNTITGAVVNLAIDGISAGTIANNSASGNQGSRAFNCAPYSANVTASDWGSASIQQSYVCKRFHSSDCSAVCQ